MNEKVLGKNISELRKKRNLTQQDLAQEMGKSTSTIAMWETGARDPNSEMIAELANYFGVTSDYLLGLTDDPHSNNLHDQTESAEPFVRTIQRAAKNMSQEEQERALKFMKLAFDKAFTEEDD